MINKTHLKNKVAWAKIEEIRQCERVIAALKLAAEPTGLSLAGGALESMIELTPNRAIIDIC